MSLLPELDKFDHGGYWHPSTRYLTFYCMIPKNASSWISQLLGHNGWSLGTIENCPIQRPIDELIVVLRDPVDRWIAGIAQYLSSYVLNTHWYDRDKFSSGYSGPYIKSKLNYMGPVMSGHEFVKSYNDLTERILFEQIAFDDHTAPQHWFVDKFKNPGKYSWFYLNDDFERFFLKYYSEFPLTPVPEPDYNQGNDNQDIRIVTDFLKNRIEQRPYLRHNLERFYAKDYELIKNVDFIFYHPEDIDDHFPPKNRKILSDKTQ